MNPIEATIGGTLQPDGTLVLDSKSNLSPGRATVVLRQEAQAPPPEEDWWQHLQRIRAERMSGGNITPDACLL